MSLVNLRLVVFSLPSWLDFKCRWPKQICNLQSRAREADFLEKGTLFYKSKKSKQARMLKFRGLSVLIKCTFLMNNMLLNLAVVEQQDVAIHLLYNFIPHNACKMFTTFAKCYKLRVS